LPSTEDLTTPALDKVYKQLNMFGYMPTLPEIEVTKITDNMYKVLVHDYVNLIAFGGPDGILLIDSGFKETAEQVRLKLKEMWNNTVQYIINTHADRDHCGGNSILGSHATIIAHRNCWKVLSEQNTRLKKGLPAITFEDSLTLHFNSEKLRLISMIGCHSGEDIIVHFKRANIVFLGDIIIADSFPFVRLERGGSIETLSESLEKIINSFPENVKLIVAHGRDYILEDLRNYREMLVKTIEIISKATKAGKNAKNMKKEGILKEWDTWNNKKYAWINTDLWIDTVYNSLKKRDLNVC